MDKFICIHGHFYQPPRENPWLEAIEMQDSAFPYHDWNERITAECYAPNMASRILDGEGRITEIVNNYSKISFNFGPTLLSWLQDKMPDVYQSLLEADEESQANFSGHGSAMAQCYNHMIMPLANTRDKFTQILWGIHDFKSRFHRHPEGMWLPETAVDLETLDLMAQLGIQFTVLAPHQAKQVRKLGDKEWKDVGGAHVDPTQPYVLNLPSGRKINLFFYDGPISRSVAFESLLRQGEYFANRLMRGFSENKKEPQLVHIATDGETYGHHHRYGEMAISYALRFIETNNLGIITNYGEYLEKNPPTQEAEIFENTSWSCAHGLGRWSADCGCRINPDPTWNQAWREPLREAFDWLRDTINPYFETQAKKVLKDPWSARDSYIDVILNRTHESIDQFLSEHSLEGHEQDSKIEILKLMELQRNLQLMYTSCGWFFDDLSGIETVQILSYTGRALQLAAELFGQDWEPEFLILLEKAKSNLPDKGTGRDIFEKQVRTMRVDLNKVAAHFAMNSLFESYEKISTVYCFTVEKESYRLIQSGKARLAVGRVKVTSQITQESEKINFGVLHLGDHNLTGGTRTYVDEADYENLMAELTSSFEKSDLTDFFRVINQQFPQATYSLQGLFHDEQRKILALVLESTLKEAEAAYRQIYEDHVLLLRFLSDLNMPLPKPFYNAAEFSLNVSLKKAFMEDSPDVHKIKSLMEEAKRTGVALNREELGFTLQNAINRLTEQFQFYESELSLLQNLTDLVGLAHTLPFSIDFWRSQNIFYEMMFTILPVFRAKAAAGEEKAKTWIELFTSLGDKLRIRLLPTA